MMCQFHSGTIMDQRPHPWRVIGPPRPSCYHGNPSVVVGCHASHHGSCLHGNNAIACCHETELLRQLAGSWSLWKPVPVPAASTFVGTAAAGYYRNGGAAAGCRSNTSARKSVTSFSISAILGGGGHSSSEEDRKRKSTTGEDQTGSTKSSIIRPWDDDDDVSNDPSSCSREWRRSDEDGEEEEDMEVVARGVVDDDDYGREMDEEEIDVGGGGGGGGSGGSGKAMAEVGLGSGRGSSSDCPLDALLRMTSQTHFIHQRINNNTQATTTTMMTTTTIDYNSDDSGAGPQFPSPSKATSSSSSSSSLFHRSSSSSLPAKKRRKTRTAFTNNQIFQLEKRFLYQKYLTPTDRDELAMSLRLTNSQVITWFQNRRAKLKRDLEELKADVSAAKALGNEPSTSVLSRLDELIKANDSGLKKKDRNAGDTSRPPITKSPPNKTMVFKPADEETVVSSSTTAKDISSLC